MHFKGCAALLFALVLGVNYAGAETINIDSLGVTPGISIKMFYDDDGAGGSSGGTKTMVVSSWNWRPSAGSSNSAPFNQNFSTFCIDIDSFDMDYGAFTIKPLQDGPTTDGEGTAGSSGSNTSMSDQQADWLRELWGENYSSLFLGTTAEKQVKHAAFQLAIWELLFERDSTKSLANGYFKVVFSGATPSYVTQANSYLTSTYDAGYSAYQTGLVALTNLYGQDQVVLVPVPTTLAGGLALMTILAGRKLRLGSRCLSLFRA